MKEFKTKHGRFILGDARELIRELPSGSVDAIITDPPFGLNMDEFDNPEVFFELEDEMWRVLKPDGWLVFYYSTKKLPEAFKLKRFEYVWQICCLFHGTQGKCALGDQACSYILVFRKGNPKVACKRSDVVYGDEFPLIPFKVKDPLFKPTMANAMLLLMFTKPGDLVLDPFAGYGSIPLTCEVLGRRWLAFEIDPFKFEIAYKFIVEKRAVDVKKLRKKAENRRGSLIDYFWG